MAYSGHPTLLRTGSGAASRPAVHTTCRAEPKKQGWDAGRFASTVLFFNPLPTPGEVLEAVAGVPAKALEALRPATAAQAGPVQPTPLIPLQGVAPAQQKVVMVTGATGGLGQRVVEELLKRGARVRALVRDVDKATTLLKPLQACAAAGASLELVAADITQPLTLLPAYFDDVRGIISCTSPSVVPKEGDTGSRDKYLQGIKFYDPKIEGDTSETVDFRGIRNLVLAAAPALGQTTGLTLLDADTPLERWGALDDVVMGGASESNMLRSPGAGEDGDAAFVFAGNVTSANNGGFASVRTTNYDPKLNLSPYDALELRLLGDGQRYKAILRTDAFWDSTCYCRSFDTVPGEWQTITLPFSEFVPVFRAKTVTDGSAPALDPSSIASLQLMLSKFEYDGDLNPAFREGAFSLPLGDITARMAQPLTPRWVQASSAAVTRCDRPDLAPEQEVAIVKLNDQLGGLLTNKLRGEDEVRTSGVPYAVVRATALTEEDAGAELEISQGDTLTGKMPRRDMAQLCVALLEQPCAADVTFEVRSKTPFSEEFEAPEGQEPRDWEALLQGAGLKPRVTGRTVNGVYTGTDEDPELAARVEPSGAVM